jgi:MFS family permease
MVDTTDRNYMINWIQEMGMMCTPRVSIQWIVTIYYVAFGLGGLLLWPLPDKWGRKYTLAFFGFFHLICQWVMLLIPSYWVRFGTFAVMGFCQLKNAVCYSWLFEIVEQ